MSEDDDVALSEFSEEDTDSESEDDRAQTDGIGNAAAKQARQDAMDKLVPGLNPDEYGKMPASYYSNSQKIAPVTMGTEMRDNVELTKASSVSGMETKQSKPIRRPILPRDDFDGVDSDDETDEDDADEESEEERPQVVGEVEVDMGAEQEEFLEFSRTALGIPDDMWNNIIKDRRDRGGTYMLHKPTPLVGSLCCTTSFCAQGIEASKLRGQEREHRYYEAAEPRNRP